MDISPISAIRPVTSIRPSPAAPDLSRVFEVEYLGQSADDEYTPGNRRTARGLEDEEDDREGDEQTDNAEHAFLPPRSGTVSFFA